MSPLETKILHTLGFQWLKDRPASMSTACVTEDMDNGYGLDSYLSTDPSMRLGTDRSNWDWSNDCLYRKPNTFRYLPYASIIKH